MIAEKTEERVGGVIDLLAEEAPEWRFPKDGVFTPEAQALAENTVEDKSASDRNQDARVAANVETTDGEASGTTEGKMNAKAGNDEEDDDGGSAEDNRAPTASEEAADGRGDVDSTEEREHPAVAYGNPEGEDEAKSVEDGIAKGDVLGGGRDGVRWGADGRGIRRGRQWRSPCD